MHNACERWSHFSLIKGKNEKKKGWRLKRDENHDGVWTMACMNIHVEMMKIYAWRQG